MSNKYGMIFKLTSYHRNANKNSNIEKVLAKMLKNRHLDMIDGV